MYIYVYVCVCIYIYIYVCVYICVEGDIFALTWEDILTDKC